MGRITKSNISFSKMKNGLSLSRGSSQSCHEREKSPEKKMMKRIGIKCGRKEELKEHVVKLLF